MGDGGKSIICFGVYRIFVVIVWCRDYGEWVSGFYFVVFLSFGLV